MRNLKRALSLALASVMVLGMTVVGTGASYTDVTSKQNQEAIEVLQAVGIMVGDDNGNFNPDQKVTRNEMAVVMSNLMDYRAATYAGTSPFTDVPSWAEPYVAACWNNGITSGYTKTTYGGSDTVTTSQAALMLMKALGYFQYSSDFGTDWQFATIKQATKIDLFDDVDSGVRDAMTRNDLAQLVLNALETPTVEAEKDGQDIEVNGVTISSNVKYNYITSTKDYAKAIDNQLQSNTDGTKLSGKTVELGEKLYSGDLKKSNNSDDFGRPGSTWTYKSSEIGKYADSADGEWTAKVTNKALYNAAGSDAYDNYKWTVYRNGVNQAGKDKDGNEVEATNAAKKFAFGGTSKTGSERVASSGDGVLTQVFVDSDKKTAVVSMIDTGVAKVTKVTENDGEYEVTVSFKTRIPGVTADTKYTSDTKFAKDDVVVYTAAGTEIQSMAKAKTVAGKVTAQSDADYTTIDGTKYAYNYAYTGDKDDSKFIGAGLYNLEDNARDKNPEVDKDATLYLDANGYAVAYEGKTSSAEDYLYVKAIDTAYGDVSAKVVFFDGTQKTVDIDKVNGLSAKPSAYDEKTHEYTNKPSKDTGIVTPGYVYKYTAGSSDYDLDYVENFKNSTADDVKISNKNPSISLGGKSITTDSQTVFVDVENNKTWTGYKNVSNKTGANVAAVKNSDGVAEIVFIFGDYIGSSANDDDYVILKGTDMEAVKDSNKKSVYKLTAAYDIHGNLRDDLYVTKSNKDKLNSKGLYLITNYDGDDYISGVTKLATFKNTEGSAVAAAAGIYAESAKNNVLSLSKDIDLNHDTTGKTDKQNNHSVFAYDEKTEFVVIEMKENNKDVNAIRTGDISDLVAYADANLDKDKDGKITGTGDLTGVYVMTVDNDQDDTPLATSILVIVPYVK